MTGAPKIRTVRLLEQIEQYKPRGPYSGVMGYFSYLVPCTTLSVVIRTAVVNKPRKVFSVGAGGGITILSDPTEEFEEMKSKANSVLNALFSGGP